jgi:hypothetical protein
MHLQVFRHAASGVQYRRTNIYHYLAIIYICMNYDDVIIYKIDLSYGACMYGCMNINIIYTFA